MCGIAGISFIKEIISEENIKKNLLTSRQLLASRGPDSNGLFYNSLSSIGLVHTRLSIQDLSIHGHQPMSSGDGRYTIIFNGEIYNPEELKTYLDCDDNSNLRGSSDTEVLLNFCKYNLDRDIEFVNWLPKINGIFSFAIFDSFNGNLYLTRDRNGVKPLYISSFDGGFAFASEIKALLPLISTCNNLDINALHKYMSFLYCPGDSTPFEIIKKVNPAEILTIKSGKVISNINWIKPYNIKNKNLIFKDKNSTDIATKLRNSLRASVHRQMVSDVPLGAFLSGGLDSSSILYFAKEINPNIKSFTIDFQGGQDIGFSHDLPWAEKVAKYLNIDLKVIKVSPESFIKDLPFMVTQLDEPIADPAALNVYYISKLARDSGIKVLLSGTGGDDLFTGYRRHQAAYIYKKFDFIPIKFRRILSYLPKRFYLTNIHFNRLRILLETFILEGNQRIINNYKWNRGFDLIDLFSHRYKKLISFENASEPFNQKINSLPMNSSELEKMLALEQGFYLPDHNLLYTDKMSMACGVEVRVPFLDNEVLNLSHKIPMKYKQNRLKSKWILKKAMRGLLPDNIIDRPKTGFGLPLRRWIKHELRDLISDLLSFKSVKSRDIFDPYEVTKLIESNDKGLIDASYTIFSLLCIEMWCLYYIDKKDLNFKTS